MKKILSLLLAITMVTAMAAGCANTGSDETNGNGTTVAESALEILQTVWGKFSEDEKFPVYGGDSANMVDGAPGDFSVSDTDGLSNNLMVPEAQLANIDQAASMIHGMMVNNFTCGVFRLKDDADADAFADAMQDAFKNNRWLCGQPEQLLVAVLGDGYVLAAFGLGEVLSTFQSKLSAAYPDTQIKHTGSIA